MRHYKVNTSLSWGQKSSRSGALFSDRDIVIIKSCEHFAECTDRMGFSSATAAARRFVSNSMRNHFSLCESLSVTTLTGKRREKWAPIDPYICASNSPDFPRSALVIRFFLLHLSRPFTRSFRRFDSRRSVRSSFRPALGGRIEACRNKLFR